MTEFKVSLPAEWEEQAFVQLTWPTEETDWAPYLDEAIECYNRIAEEIQKRETLYIFRGDINDTWARDHAFITTRGPLNKLYIQDFQFNGWGLKFAANHDNQINKHFREEILGTMPQEVYEHEDTFEKRQAIANLDPIHKFFHNSVYMHQQDIVLEGGSIESDGKGTILTTEDCLMAPNRNHYYLREQAEEMLKQRLGAERILWLKDVGLTGDDTDSHIDTLARFAPNDTIVFAYEDTDKSEQSWGLKSMKAQLESFRTKEGKPYRLIPLPMPYPVEFDGEILPATYANFLIINGAVLVPTYNQPDKDSLAMYLIHQAFPDREIVGIDCRVLVKQHGSLHCVTMQYPKL